jgi:hypothetical protein
LKASLQIDGIDEDFSNGFELEREHHDVPAGMIGRLLTQEEAEALLKKLARRLTPRSSRRTLKCLEKPAEE